MGNNSVFCSRQITAIGWLDYGRHYLTINHLLYADDVKLLAPRKKSDALQNSLLASSKWTEDWALILNPS